MMKALLVKYGEIALRGANRGIYEKMLADAIRRNVEPLGGGDVIKEQGRFLVKSADLTRALDAVRAVFGVVAVCPCLLSEEQGLANLKQMAVEHLTEAAGAVPFTFKVETTRADKRYPFTSYEISAAVGEFVIENMSNAKVDVHAPDLVVRVELRNNAYVYSRTFDGNGGLPPGSSGRGALLLSGGFDSPVAGFLAAKRGIAVTAVYFHSPPYTSERAKEKVKDLAARLAYFAGSVKLYSVPFTDVQLMLRDRVQAEKLTILLKRAMIRTAEKIARRDGAIVLITGDSVGQVASQTLRSIAAVDSAAGMPVIRPLACFDKREIIDLARKIGTFDISARPYDDCCTLFVADHPETKPKVSIIEGIERKLLGEAEPLMDAAAEGAELYEF